MNEPTETQRNTQNSTAKENMVGCDTAQRRPQRVSWPALKASGSCKDPPDLLDGSVGLTRSLQPCFPHPTAVKILLAESAEMSNLSGPDGTPARISCADGSVLGHASSEAEALSPRAGIAPTPVHAQAHQAPASRKSKPCFVRREVLKQANSSLGFWVRRSEVHVGLRVQVEGALLMFPWRASAHMLIHSAA